jgi:flagellum-specific ATP synthase
MTTLAHPIRVARTAPSLGITGRVRCAAGLTIEAVGLPVPLGSMCEVHVGHDRVIPAEVIGFRDEATLLMPLTDAEGLAPNQRVRFVTSSQNAAVGPGLLGRVVDGLGQPADGGAPILAHDHYPLYANPPDPMTRPRINAPLSVGIRSINALTTIGAGQRIGVFAGTGVGKSVLLGMMARHTSADVAVVALVGERGREVAEFIAKDLGPVGLKRSVVVMSTSDQPPPLRVRACFVATAIAEYFRDQGASVLLLMDSVTRFAMAARQIALAAGEPPATKGYPPSVFGLMPRLLERSGRSAMGSITGLYTVLVEGDDINEPVADAVRGVLDGHIWLSRRLANRGQFPAVSVIESISRVMTDVVTPGHVAAATKVRGLLAVWADIEDLVNIGAYAAGTNPEYDLAVRMRPAIESFLKQSMEEGVSFPTAESALTGLSDEIDATKAALTSAVKPSARPADARR